MTWILLALLLYTLLGAALVSRNMRGMQVAASLPEWLVLILLWPFMLQFLLQLAVLQARIHQLERWGHTQARKR